MERLNVKQAVADAGRPPSKPAASSSPSGSNESAPERMRMFTKLMTLYPVSAGQDLKALIAALIDETSDLPAKWLSHALARLVREPDRKFAPTVGEIRGATLRVIRAARWAANGGPPQMPHGEPPLRESMEISWARSNTPQIAASGVTS